MEKSSRPPCAIWGDEGSFLPASLPLQPPPAAKPQSLGLAEDAVWAEIVPPGPVSSQTEEHHLAPRQTLSITALILSRKPPERQTVRDQ